MELFDAVDQLGNKLGFDLIRGERIPEGVFHKVVQIFTFNQKNELLVTLRHPDKIFGLLWEVTAGSVIKGENETQGAIRELEEETGILVSPTDLKHLYTMIEEDSIWSTYLVKTNINSPQIRYQDLETIDHRWIDSKTFMTYLNEGRFPEPMRQRMKEHWELLKQALKEHADFDII